MNERDKEVLIVWTVVAIGVIFIIFSAVSSHLEILSLKEENKNLEAIIEFYNSKCQPISFQQKEKRILLACSTRGK